jgi:hypothetical protein
MEEKTKRAVRKAVLLAFFIIVIGLLIYSRVTARPTKETFKDKLSAFGLWGSPSYTLQFQHCILLTILATLGYASSSLSALLA